MKKVIPEETRVRLMARILGVVMPWLYSTLRITSNNESRIEEYMRQHQGAVLATWHGRASIFFVRFAGRGYHALVSPSNDGEVLSRMFERFGWKPIRGSSGRRAVQGLRQGNAMLSVPGAVLAVTPDGPRGPARVVKPGMLYFAQKHGKPVVVAGVAASPHRLLSSWDSFELPLPFGRVHIEYGEPIFIEPDEELPDAALRVQNAINELEARAEAIVLGTTANARTERNTTTGHRA